MTSARSGVVTYLDEVNPVTGLIDPTSFESKGSELREQYESADPFPHIAIDDFLPASLLERCLEEFPPRHSAEQAFDRQQERSKRSFSPDALPPFSRQLFYSFNSRPFIQLVENISGINGLIPDPYFLGGGFHEIAEGGHLSMHADFNHHRRLNLERRVNVLIYLNKEWRDEFGGQLELWDNEMKTRVHSYVPHFNRCVMFSTTSHSNHGNPNPVRHPDGTPRRSIALYYYTATWDGTKRQHATQFRVRPGTEDQHDVTVKRGELIADLLPPIVYRGIRRIRDRDSAK